MPSSSFWGALVATAAGSSMANTTAPRSAVLRNITACKHSKHSNYILSLAKLDPCAVIYEVIFAY